MLDEVLAFRWCFGSRCGHQRRAGLAQRYQAAQWLETHRARSFPKALHWWELSAPSCAHNWRQPGWFGAEARPLSETCIWSAQAKGCGLLSLWCKHTGFAIGANVGLI